MLAAQETMVVQQSSNPTSLSKGAWPYFFRFISQDGKVYWIGTPIFSFPQREFV
jgi:hypothetical protein